MDYEEQSRKERPFEGLSLEEAKRLFVYMCHVAHPSLAPDEIERRWGKVLPDDEIPTVFEALEIAGKIKEEIIGSDVQNTELASQKDNGGKRSNRGGKIFTCLFMFSVPLFGFLVCIIVDDQSLWQKQKVRQEVTSLTSAAQQLLSNSNESTVDPSGFTKKGNSANDLLNMGLELQRLRGKMLVCGWIRDSDEFVLIEELLLKCYKRASTHHSDSYGKEEGQMAAEAAAFYRLSLLYLPHKYREFVREEDKVASLSENYDVATNFLNAAVERNQYNAIKLIINIDLEQRRENKNNAKYFRMIAARITENKKRLAQHPDATSNDIYQYAVWIAETHPSEAFEYLKKAAEMGDENALELISETHPSESLKYLKKAAEMGNEKAKKILLILREEALAEGNTLEE